MKTYRNEKHGFEIDIPEAWSPASTMSYALAKAFLGSIPPGVKKDCFQYGCPEEAFNFEIGPLFPEPLLEDTEDEFRLYARDRGFIDLHFRRIIVCGKEHVCAHYFILDKMGPRWNKKFMVVFGGIEYTITGTCNDPQWFAKREKDWDAIVQSFRLLAPVDDSANATDRAWRTRDKRREIVQNRIVMREITGDLYAQAYEAVAKGQDSQARGLLEQCLQGDPDHVLAHKEMAVVLEKLGDVKGALRHRREVKRLQPADLVNRANLVQLLAGSEKRAEAQREVGGVLAAEPDHPVFVELKEKLATHRFLDYRLSFYSCLISLLFLDISLFLPEHIYIRHVGCMALLMILPVVGMVVSGPWVGIPRFFSGLMAVTMYLFFILLELR